jgi:hypothetical protein
LRAVVVPPSSALPFREKREGLFFGFTVYLAFSLVLQPESQCNLKVFQENAGYCRIFLY